MLSRFYQAQRTCSKRTNLLNCFLSRSLRRETPAGKRPLLVPRACLTSVAGEASSKQANGEQKTTEEHERQQRQRRLVAVMIGSSVGFLGGSYALYKRLTNNRAEAQPAKLKEDQEIDEVDSSGDVSEGKDQEPTKKKRKSFKARRVSMF